MHKTQLRILAFFVMVLVIFNPSQQVMGMLHDHVNQNGFSGASYTYHGAGQVGDQLSDSSCVNCHSSPQAFRFRSIMVSAGITCTSCHGIMTQFGETGRKTISSLPACSTCHHQPLISSARQVMGGMSGFTGVSGRSSYDVMREHQQYGRLTEVSSDFMKCSACHTANQAVTFWHFGMEQ